MPESISSSTSAAAAAASSSTSNALGQLDSNAFLKLLTAQMRYQNPFSPSDPSAMLGQVATYAQVEALQKIQAAQATSSSLEQARMAGEIMGKRVTGTDANGTTLTGIVASARFTASGPVLTLDNGKEMPLNRLEVIAPGTPLATTPAATTPAATTPASTPASDTGTSGTGTTGTGATGTGTGASGASGTSSTGSSSSSSGSSSGGSSSSSGSGTSGSGTAATDTAAVNRTIVAAVTSYAAAVAATRRSPALVA